MASAGAPGVWQLTRLQDGLVRSIASGDVVDGLRIDVGPTLPSAGDRYLLQPVTRGANGMQRVLDDGVARLSQAGHQAKGVLLVGDTVDEICRHATEVGANLIVVGHRHLDSWAARWWKTPLSKALIAHAPCSVLVAITR